MERYKKVSILILSLLIVIEVLGILFFGSTAIKTALSLIFSPASVDWSLKELIFSLYLPFLLLGISGGFVWLAFKTAKIINGIRGVENIIDHSSYKQYGNWKIITVMVIIVLTISYVVRVFLGPQ